MFQLGQHQKEPHSTIINTSTGDRGFLSWQSCTQENQGSTQWEDMAPYLIHNQEGRGQDTLLVLCDLGAGLPLSGPQFPH